MVWSNEVFGAGDFGSVHRIYKAGIMMVINCERTFLGNNQTNQHTNKAKKPGSMNCLEQEDLALYKEYIKSAL